MDMKHDVLRPEDTVVKELGPRLVSSPLGFSSVHGDGIVDFVPEGARVTKDVVIYPGETPSGITFEKSGPLRDIYFDPNDVTAAIMTCGGLCPGLNNVIRAIVMELHYKYNVKNILGIRYGHKGLDPNFGYPPIKLTPENVTHIHEDGGTILGTSRGTVDVGVMVNSLVNHGINVLFCLGGDGTQRGLHEICEEASSRGLEIAFVGLPKTIDNDISYVYKTFGLDTAVTVACDALRSAHNEAQSAYNGIGLVKVMGRHSGYIASYATLANLDVNFCLIPELDFDLHGPGAFLECLQRRLYHRKHAVIVVAEGAGQKFFDKSSPQYDASGNALLADIGLYLREEIKKYFKERKIPIDLKFIDPSYMVRSVTTNANDSIYTADIARHAVHAAMAGKTDMMVGLWHGEFINLPLPVIINKTKKVDTESSLWMSVLSSTGQPMSMLARKE